jgi:hypothetical protein
VSWTLSKTFDYSDDDQLTNSNANEQVDPAEGIENLRLEKGYAVTDERHLLTLYGEAQLPRGFSVAPSAVAEDGIGRAARTNTLVVENALSSSGQWVSEPIEG